MIEYASTSIPALGQHYTLSPVTACRLLQRGFNDHYLLVTRDGSFVLRVYQRGWRTADAIAYELAVLAHLHRHGVPVCAPIARSDGAWHSTLDTAEGPCTAVLFDYAEGHAPAADNATALRACGRLMAQIHRHTDDFTCPHTRFMLDAAHLLVQPCATLLPLLAHRPEDAAVVQRAADLLHAALAQHEADGEWGYCHGDFHGGNARLAADGTLRVFDFDCGGPGWRTYDIAVCRLFCGDEPHWAIFCAGYAEIRPLPANTHNALPIFLAARQLWRMSAFAANWSRLTGGEADDTFFDTHLGVLRERMAGMKAAE